MQTRIVRTAVTAVTALTFSILAACGSSGGDAAATVADSSADTVASTAASDAAADAVSIDSTQGSDGTYLIDGDGRSVYLWVADQGGTSTCSGSCASAWPPVTTTGQATANGDAVADEIGTVSRSDGSTQVTYHGHPLYYFTGDNAPGDTNGQGSDGFGAKWWLVTPSGDAITAPDTAVGGYSY